MGTPFLELQDRATSAPPLSMDRECNSVPMENDHVVVIDDDESSISNSSHDGNVIGLPQDQNTVQHSVIRRTSERVRNTSPLDSGLWISVEILLTLSQIVAVIVVLLLSKNEHHHTPLFLWVIGYASGCFAILPLLCLRYHYRNQFAERESSTTAAATSDGHNTNIPNPRLKVFVEYYKFATDFFFAVWFVTGIVWVSGGQASAAKAPNLYRVSIVLLTFSCIGYAIMSILGSREGPTQIRGASSELINSLPTYKFKAKNNDKEKGVVDGGIVTTGTEEHMLSGEDAVCCICLVKYSNNDELKELPCSHFFHKECIDKWLKIKATCPLCKAEVGQTVIQQSLHPSISSTRLG